MHVDRSLSVTILLDTLPPGPKEVESPFIRYVLAFSDPEIHAGGSRNLG